MEKQLVENLNVLCARFRGASGLMESTIAKRMADDARFFANLRNGQTTTLRKYDRVVERFADDWPENADWPEGIDRPARSKVADSEQAEI